MEGAGEKGLPGGGEAEQKTGCIWAMAGRPRQRGGEKWKVAWGESGKVVWVKEVPRSELRTLSSIRDNPWRVLREQKEAKSEFRW